MYSNRVLAAGLNSLSSLLRNLKDKGTLGLKIPPPAPERAVAALDALDAVWSAVLALRRTYAELIPPRDRAVAVAVNR